MHDFRQKHGIPSRYARQALSSIWEIMMKLFTLAIAAGMLSACVSAPSELYGIHQAKPETASRQEVRLAPEKQTAAVNNQH